MGTIHTKLTGYEDSYQEAVRENAEREINFKQVVVYGVGERPLMSAMRLFTDPKEAAQSQIDLSLHQMD